MNWLIEKLSGKRTYITIALLLLHQMSKRLGLDISDEQLSSALDTLLILLAGLFRYLAKPKEACDPPATPTK